MVLSLDFLTISSETMFDTFNDHQKAKNKILSVSFHDKQNKFGISLKHTFPPGFRG